MILVIDNYDSFTYNLVQYLGVVGAEVSVHRNDQISLDEAIALKPDGILLSPGPCTPAQSGVCLDILRAAMEPGSGWRTPILGVCLGHQAIGLVAGAVVDRAKRIRHGKASPIRHTGVGVFEGLPNPFSAIRYHSLVILRETLPPSLEVTAESEDDGEIMGVRHRTLPIEGVQFHPESVLTEGGMDIVRNFVRRAGASV
ncbi:MAG: aminodeoxychorismate/anthranilate synthase component II [Fimbriimonadales bacterium]|nr:aminodeoxychorismate/anthranilate synthase component II [Fimbriimonadales bacterium]